MKQGPLVSVLVNCYNGEKYLKEALDSIRAQTYINWEIIFWDNQSTDRSAEIFKSYDDPRFKYFRAPVHTDLGGGRARAWEYLTGDFIAVLDADDVWLPCKLEKQIPLFSDPDVGVVICDTLFFNDKREKPLYGGKYPPVGWVFEQLVTAYYVSLETVVFRRATALRLKRGFDSDFSFIADFDIVVRLSRISKLALYPEILAKWRVHAASGSWTYPLTFVKEKKRWLEKQIAEEPEFARKYAKAIGRFKSKNLRAEVALELINHRRICAFRLLMKSAFDHWHAWALLLICLMPFSGSITSYLYKRKFELA